MKTWMKKLLLKVLIFIIAVILLPFTDNTSRIFLTISVLAIYLFVDLIFLMVSRKK